MTPTFDDDFQVAFSGLYRISTVAQLALSVTIYLHYSQTRAETQRNPIEIK